MTQLLVEEQPVPDDENAKKPAILKHQSIILTDEELKELGMKDQSENVITCEITEEEEYNVGAECDEKAILDEGAENNEDGNHETDVPNPDMDASTNETNATDDCDKENELETEGNTDENNIQDDQNADADDNKNETESNENKLDPEHKETVEAEVANEDIMSKDMEKGNDIKQKPLTRPISGHKFKIPPMWTPANPRANAAFVYIFFRHVSLHKTVEGFFCKISFLTS